MRDPSLEAIVAANDDYRKGYHDGNAGGLRAVDTDLAVGNIRQGKTVFGLPGTVAAYHDDAWDGGIQSAGLSTVSHKYTETDIDAGDNYQYTGHPLTVVEGAVIEAFGMAHVLAEAINKLKMQLLIGGVLVAESGYISTTGYSVKTVMGYREGLAAGDYTVALEVKNYDTETRWVRRISYYLGEGSVSA